MKNKFKALSLILMFLFCLSFLGACGNNASPDLTNPDKPLPETDEPEKPGPDKPDKPGGDLLDFNVDLLPVEKEYDGKPVEFEFTSPLPEGTQVIFSEEKIVDAGSYKVMCKLLKEGYNSLELETFVRIFPKRLEGYELVSETISYDGLEHNLTKLNKKLPEDLELVYDKSSYKDAGTYDIYAHIEGNKNYEPLELHGILTITKALVKDLVFEDLEVTYDGKPHSLEVLGLPKDVKVNYENNKQTNFGTYEVTARFYHHENYEMPSFLTATLKINKVKYELDVKLPEFVYTYDGEYHEVELEKYIKLPHYISYYIDAKFGSEVGNYPFTINFEAKNKNYLAPDPIESILVINPLTFDLSKYEVESLEVTYDGYPHYLNLKESLPYFIQYEITNQEQTDAGVYEASCEVRKNPNINFIGKVKSGTLTINKAPYKGFEPEGYEVEYTYDGTEKQITYSDYSHDYEVLSYENNGLINVGSKEVTVNFKSLNPNYEAPKSIIMILTVTKAFFYPNINAFLSQSFVYEEGVKRSLEYKDELPLGISVSYENNGQTNVGDYVITANFSHNENYEDIRPLKADLYITKATFDTSTLIFEAKTYTYDGSAHSVQITNLPNWISVSYVNNDQIDAGDYLVTANFSHTNPNYKDIDSIETHLIIKGIVLDIKDFVFEDAVYTYDGTYKKRNDVYGLFPGIYAVYTMEGQYNPGKYLVEAKILSETNNYLCPEEKLQAYLIINKGNLDMSKVEITNKEITYNGYLSCVNVLNLPENIMPRFYYNNEEVDGLVNAGTYEILIKFDNIPYGFNTPDPIKTTFTIRQKVFDKELIYNSVNFDYNGEEQETRILTYLESDIKVRYENNKQTNAGNYQARAYLSNEFNNYIFKEYYEWDWVINKATYPTLYFDSEEILYDGLPHTLVSTATIPEGLKASYSENTLTLEGRLEVTLTFINENPNYVTPEPLKAVLEIIRPTWNIRFFADGNLLKSLKIKHLDKVDLKDIPEVPEKTGYTSSWDYDFTQEVKCNKDLLVKREIITYHLKFVTDKTLMDAPEDIAYTIEDEFQFPYYDHLLKKPDLSKFLGWYEEATYENYVSYIKRGTYGDKTLYGKFSAPYILNTEGYTIYDPGLSAGKIKGKVTYDIDKLNLETLFKTYDGSPITVYNTYSEKPLTGAVDIFMGYNEYIIKTGDNFLTYEVTIIRPYSYTYKFTLRTMNSHGSIVKEETTNEVTIPTGGYLEKPYVEVPMGYDFIDYVSPSGSWPYLVNEDSHNDEFFAYLREKTYDVNFNCDYDVDNENYPNYFTYKELPLTLKPASKEHYTFLGWYLDSDFKNEIKVLTEPKNYNIYPKFQEITYYVTINPNNGEEPFEFPYTISEGNKPLPKLEKWGYYLNSYLSENGQYHTINAENAAYNPKALNAEWFATSYKINYHNVTKDQLLNSRDTYNIERGFFDSLPEEVNVLGYRFLGWYLDSDFKTSVNTLVDKTFIGDKDIYAKLSLAHYKITYNLSGGVNNPLNKETFTMNDQVFKLEAPTRNGYKFIRFENNYSEEITEIDPSIRLYDFTLTAIWEALSYNYTFHYPFKDETGTYTTGYFHLPYSTPNKEGYTFDGWYKDQEFKELVTEADEGSIYGDIHLYPKFITGSDVLTYVLENGSYYVNGLTGRNRVMIVPETYQGLPVKGIKAKAFGSNGYEVIVLPKSLETIAPDTLLDTYTCFRGSYLSSYETGLAHLNKDFILYNYLDLKTNSEGFEYLRSNDGIAKIISYKETGAKELVIPKYLDNYYLVNYLDEKLFRAHDCLSVTKLFINSEVTKLPYLDNSFKNITYLEITSSVLINLYQKFSHCKNLEEVKLSDSILVIGNSCFYGLNKLKKINIPKNLQKIGSLAFADTSISGFIDLPDSLTQIGSSAFINTKINLITIPLNVTFDVTTEFEGVHDLAFLIKADKLDPNWNFNYYERAETGYDYPVAHPYVLNYNGVGGLTSEGFKWGVDAKTGLGYFLGYCGNLLKIQVPSMILNNKITIMQMGAMARNNEVQEMEIMEGFKVLANDSLAYNKTLKHLMLPSSLESMLSAIDYQNQTLVIYTVSSKLPEDYYLPSEDKRYASYNQSVVLNCDRSFKHGIDNNFGWALRKDGYGIFSHYYGDEIMINVPSILGGYEVKEIAGQAFNQINHSIDSKTIKIPEGVTLIRDKAFADLNLDLLVLPSTVEIMESQMFFHPLKETIILNNSSTIKLEVYNDIIYTGKNYPLVYDDVLSKEILHTNDYDYLIYNDHTAKLMKYKGNEETVVVPSMVDNYRVSSILKYCFNKNLGVKKIIFENGIVGLDDFSIFSLDNLTNLYLPYSVTDVEDGAFRVTQTLIIDYERPVPGDKFLGYKGHKVNYCANQSSVMVQGNYSYILLNNGPAALVGIKNPNNEDLLNFPTVLGGREVKYALNGTYEFKIWGVVYIPKCYEYIGNLVVEQPIGDSTSYFGLQGLLLMEQETLYKNFEHLSFITMVTGVRKLVLPEKGINAAYTDTREYIFGYNGDIPLNLTFGNNPKYKTIIASYAFDNRVFKNVTFGPNFYAVGYGAFEGTTFDSIKINEGMESVSNRAFMGITLKSGELRLPKSLVRAGEAAFSGEGYKLYIPYSQRPQDFHSKFVSTNIEVIYLA